LAPEGTGFPAWAARLSSYAGSSEVRGELDHWLALADAPHRSLPLDYPEGRAHATFETSRSVEVTLPVEETQSLLYDVPKAYRTLTGEVLLTALAQALSPWAGGRSLLVDLEGNGREVALDRLHLNRTVGWFTTVYPALLDLRFADGPGDAIKAVKETLRRVPNEGLGYGLLRYLSQDSHVTRRMRELPRPEISFLYLGQLDQAAGDTRLPRPAREDAGPLHSPQAARPYLLEISAGVREGRLLVEWRYSAEVHRRETIERLADQFLAALSALIRHCLAPDAGGYTPSDFAMAELTQDELDEMLATFAD
jgi:non-ribosomal peptide synthase protein (TIGR01720 family)